MTSVSTHAFAIRLAAVLALASGCGSSHPSTVREGGVVAYRVTRLGAHAPPRDLTARPGDWILEGRHLRVVVGGLARTERERGAILQARLDSVAEEESELRIGPSVHVGRDRQRVIVREIVALSRGGRPVLRIVGEVRSSSGEKYIYARELTLSRRDAVVGIASMLVRVGHSRQVILGDRVEWGGRDVFVPGAGWVVDENTRDVSFIGVEGAETGMAFASNGAPIRIRATFDRHGSTQFLEHTDVEVSRSTGADDRITRARAVLVIARGGLSDAVRRVGWSRGAPFAEAVVSFPYAPAGTTARITTHERRPILEAHPRTNGVTIVPLPPIRDAVEDDYVVVGGARGHADSDPVTIARNSNVRVRIPHGGSVRIQVRDAATGRGIPSRVRFVPANRNITVNLGPDWAANGARDSVVMREGDADVPLVPGRYRVIVTHGPEWTMHDQTVDVSETFRPDVKANLAHVVDPGRYVGCDLHVHASPSPDSQVTLDDRVASLVAEGIGFAVPTDHNHVTDYAPSAAALGLDASSFLTVMGVEATTANPAFGHFNAYPVPVVPGAPGDGAPAWDKVTPADLFASMRALGPGVLVQVNHPRLEGGIGFFDASGYDPTTGTASGAYSDDYDALEIWNGFDLARQPAFDRVFGEWLLMVARGRHVTAVGNSDSHKIRYEWAGYPRTYVRPLERTPLAIVAAIRAGHAFVTSGPFLDVSIGTSGPGDTATVTNGLAALHVHVQTAPFSGVDRLEVWMNGAKVHSVPLAPTPPTRARAPRGAALARAIHYDARLAIPVRSDSAIVVVVRGSRTLDDYFGRAMIPPLAVANPIWIDADGDGSGPVDARDPLALDPDAMRDGGSASDAGSPSDASSNDATSTPGSGDAAPR